MKAEALRAILWVRWRVLVNRMRRAGAVGQALVVILLVFGIAGAITSFAGTFLLGLYQLSKWSPMETMLVWSGIAGAFLFFWIIGLVTDLQRGDSMSLRNLLHLPVSLRWVFLCNYVGSFVSLSSLIFLPALLGLALAMVVEFGASMWLVFGLVAAFYLMLTALTYQLRGWLGRLMEDKRRGRNVVVLVTIAFFLLIQVPNLWNLSHSSSRSTDRFEELQEAREVVSKDPNKDAMAALREIRDAKSAATDRLALRVTKLVPFGWLPYGVRSGLDGRWWIASLCGLGMFAIGGWSLRWSYVSTLQGVTKGGRNKVKARVPQEGARASGSTLFVARSLPMGSDGMHAVLFANLRSLIRAPEAKLIMLSPILLLAFGMVSLGSNGLNEVATEFRPYLTLGPALLGMLSLMQLTQNQFGLDRAGFRSFVLSPLPRYEILLGKNFSLAPLACGISLGALALLRAFVPLSLEILTCGVLQIGSSFLLLSLLSNVISILGPMRLQDQGLQAADSKARAFVWQLSSMVLYPVALSPLIVPIVLAQSLQARGLTEGVPIALLLNVLLLGLATWVYRVVIRRQGAMLQAREQNILEILTRR